MFDVNTVLGQQMFKTLDWLDEAEDETRVTCCGGDGQKEAKTCGGPNGKSCKDICGKGFPQILLFHLISFLFRN